MALRGDKDFGSSYIHMRNAMSEMPADEQQRFATVVLGAALHYLRLHEVKACIDHAIGQLKAQREELAANKPSLVNRIKKAVKIQ